MRKLVYSVVLLLLVFGCKKSNEFEVSGVIKDAAKKTLFLEHTGLTKTEVIDSVKLGEDGKFSFDGARPKYPDFYRLRIDDSYIVFSVDSNEHIIINGQDAGFAEKYSVEGSPESEKIRRLRTSLIAIQTKLNAIDATMESNLRNSKITEIQNDIEKHKEMAKKVILENPRSTSAYFAVYQKVNSSFVFSPYVKEDKPYFAAVATSYNTFMPDYDRTKNLYTLVLDAIQSERDARQNEALQSYLQSKASVGYINISLKDRDDNVKSLSQLEGKLVLIDFSAYGTRESVAYTFALRDLYNKCHTRGFEIYQISLDEDKVLWQEATKNIPWVCVRDDNGPNTSYISTYNVKTIPSNFLLSKKGEIIARDIDFKALSGLIEKNL